MNKKSLKEKYGDEKIFVVPYEKLDFISDGFTPVKHSPELWSKFDAMGHYVFRYDAEGEPALQQIIPYIVITDASSEKIFTNTRISGDARLLNKISVACGGHIDEQDSGKEVLFRAAVRELFEEINIFPTHPFEIIGYVRDMNSQTNDHTGVVILIKNNNVDAISIRETETLSGEWMNLQDLINNYEKLEGWSKLIVDHFVTNKKIG